MYRVHRRLRVVSAGGNRRLPLDNKEEDAISVPFVLFALSFPWLISRPPEKACGRSLIKMFDDSNKLTRDPTKIITYK